MWCGKGTGGKMPRRRQGRQQYPRAQLADPASMCVCACVCVCVCVCVCARGPDRLYPLRAPGPGGAEGGRGRQQRHALTAAYAVRAHPARRRQRARRPPRSALDARPPAPTPPAPAGTIGHWSVGREKCVCVCVCARVCVCVSVHADLECTPRTLIIVPPPTNRPPYQILPHMPHATGRLTGGNS